MSESIANGISITNSCYECQVIALSVEAGHQEGKCFTCQEQEEARADDNAWNLHEDDRLGEGPGLSVDTSDAPSASEWVASQTVDRESLYLISLEIIKTDTGTYIDAEGNTREYNENWYHIEERVVVTKREEDYIIRQEFLPPIAQLQDGGVYEELWELDDMRQREREVQCQWCNLLTPKAFNDCTSCDKPLEHNVR
jgi:hypothetical protein